MKYVDYRLPYNGFSEERRKSSVPNNRKMSPVQGVGGSNTIHN